MGDAAVAAQDGLSTRFVFGAIAGGFALQMLFSAASIVTTGFDPIGSIATPLAASVS